MPSVNWLCLIRNFPKLKLPWKKNHIFPSLHSRNHLQSSVYDVSPTKRPSWTARNLPVCLFLMITALLQLWSIWSASRSHLSVSTGLSVVYTRSPLSSRWAVLYLRLALWWEPVLVNTHSSLWGGPVVFKQSSLGWELASSSPWRYPEKGNKTQIQLTLHESGFFKCSFLLSQQIASCT